MINTDFIQVILLEILCLFVFIICRNDFFKNTNKKSNKYFFIWLFITCFCTWFSWGHDYYNYQDLLISQAHVEPIFIDLYSLVDNNYLLWRFVVWGMSSIFVVLTFKKMETTTGLASILFILLPLMQFYCVTRNSLSLSILFYALSCVNYRTVKGWIYSIILLALAYNLHQSMPLYLFLFVFVCFVPFNRITIIVSIILFPIIKGGIILISESFITAVATESFEETGFSYIESENEMMYTTFGWIHQIFQMLPVLLILFYSLRETIFKQNAEDSNDVMKFLFFAYVLIYMSFLFWGEGSKHLQTRFWDAAYLPLCYFLSRFLYRRRTQIYVRIFYILMLASFVWRIAYNIYSY